MTYFKATVEFYWANVFLSFKKSSISTFFRLNNENDKNYKKISFVAEKSIFLKLNSCKILMRIGILEIKLWPFLREIFDFFIILSTSGRLVHILVFYSFLGVWKMASV